MSWTALAFFTGLFGSLHCVAMCGPLVMAMPFANTSLFSLVLQRLLYQAGRICVYSIFGILAGFLGRGFSMLGLQSGVSLVTGTILVLMAVSHFLGRRNPRVQHFQSRLVAPLVNLMARYLSRPYGGLFAGALNGLLPCGMVYAAMAASLNADSVLKGARFMFFFGLGTTPLMILASAAPLLFRGRLRIPLITPYLLLITGILLIWKGSDLHFTHLPGHPHHTSVECR
ncbi:MAG TPA: sulfite exporter TauE/SafE family protein [Sphingobacteriaceae bacterium]